MPSRERGLNEDLAKWFSGAERVVVAGIGNPIRMDDYVGVRIVQDLQGKVSERVMLIECETVPEGYIQQIIDFKPTHVLLIDAALLDMEPGRAALVEPEKLLAFPAYSTHMLPLRLFCEYVVGVLKAKIGLLLVEPKVAEFGEGLSPELTCAAGEIAQALTRVMP